MSLSRTYFFDKKSYSIVEAEADHIVYKLSIESKTPSILVSKLTNGPITLVYAIKNDEEQSIDECDIYGMVRVIDQDQYIISLDKTDDGTGVISKMSNENDEDLVISLIRDTDGIYRGTGYLKVSLTHPVESSIPQIIQTVIFGSTPQSHYVDVFELEN